MQANKTVTVNGRLYDAVTGMPVRQRVAEAKKPAPKPVASRPTGTGKVASSTLHQTTQRSKTLNRRATKKPGPAKRPQPGKHMDIARSGAVARFAAHPTVPAKTEAPSKPDMPAKTHPVAKRALTKTTKPDTTVAATSKQIKETAIDTALKATRPKPSKKRRWNLQFSRRFVIVTAVFAVLIAGAYLTYVNIPSLSVSIAASQAGVEAAYPEYKPDGYSLSQPVEFSDGEVILTFSSNSGVGEYTITQTRSSWDSSAVLDNVVRAASGDNYIATQERGLTIYAYDGNAAWVNGGVLYVIESNAPLSGEQIRRIATSL
jgi:hypothetical protein